MISLFNRREAIAYRSLSLDFLSDCAALHTNAFASGWPESEFERLISDRRVVADGAISGSGDQVRGFILSRVVLDEAEILTIVVTPTARGRGVGRLLSEYHFSNLNRAGVRSIFLEVAENNGAALHLYTRLGFRQIGKRNAYYPAPNGTRIAALTMKLDLM